MNRIKKSALVAVVACGMTGLSYGAAKIDDCAEYYAKGISKSQSSDPDNFKSSLKNKFNAVVCLWEYCHQEGFDTDQCLEYFDSKLDISGQGRSNADQDKSAKAGSDVAAGANSTDNCLSKVYGKTCLIDNDEDLMKDMKCHPKVYDSLKSNYPSCIDLNVPTPVEDL